MTMTDERPLATYEDYQRAKNELVEQLKDIQFQLTDKDKRDADGVRLSDEEYQNWRHRALGAMRVRERRLALVKQWLKEHEQPDELFQRALYDVYRAAQVLLACQGTTSTELARMALEGLSAAVQTMNRLRGEA